jgi:DNA-binding GntR family transcriptional regulator
MQALRNPKQLHRTTADDVAAALLPRIASGLYAPNSRLPTCASLGDEFGTHKNVISKAFQQLANEGIVDSRAGRGTYVIRRPSKAMARHAAGRVRALLTDAARLAQTSGLTLEQFLSTAGAIAEAAYDRRDVRVTFVECNLIDGRSLAAELQVILSLPVGALTIEDFIEAVARDSNAFDLAIISLARLREVEDGLRARAAVPAFPLESVFTLPAGESLTSIARLPRDGLVGIIYTMPSALSTLSGLAHATNAAATVRAALASDRDADIVLVTTAAQLFLDVTGARAALVPVTFHIDHDDGQRLASRFAQTANRLADAA